MVRLKEIAANMAAEAIDEFQFQYGSIKRNKQTNQTNCRK